MKIFFTISYKHLNQKLVIRLRYVAAMEIHYTKKIIIIRKPKIKHLVNTSILPTPDIAWWQ